MVIINNCLSGLFFLQITTPLQVLHQVKAKADCKGGKLDLSIKKGESIDIIRITDNPEGKWLGRIQDGSCKCSQCKNIYIFDVNWSTMPWEKMKLLFLYIPVGYVKTEMAEIDFSVLKNKGMSLPHSMQNEEVYDDVESMDEQL